MLAGMAACDAAAASKVRPNIVLLVADDWGYSDVGAFGGEIATPQSDSLARHALFELPLGRVLHAARAMLLAGVDNHRNDAGWTALRQSRRQRAIDMGLLP